MSSVSLFLMKRYFDNYVQLRVEYFTSYYLNSYLLPSTSSFNLTTFRDIKTTNILIDEFYRAKLCDFSFACHEECSSKKDFVYGTDEFMSPEVALALDFDKSSDIFSFGIILCELMTCKEPSLKFLNRKAQNLFSLDETQLREFIVKGCPEELEALACQCCDIDQSKRPTVQTCIEELESILSELGGFDFDYVPATDKSQALLVAESHDTTDLSVTG